MTDNAPPSPVDEGPQYIGVAHMRADGTIELHLRAEAPDGAIGEAVFVYAPDHLNYDYILAHVAPLEPHGQTSVRPFPP
ncbi:MAG TPA: hypothetical protein H9903_17435 [Candidatus Aquabacterium excrementipullorum]|nr:hypothetical protein [Candidatus Aquabacterium excrementipullorum]